MSLYLAVFLCRWTVTCEPGQCIRFYEHVVTRRGNGQVCPKDHGAAELCAAGLDQCPYAVEGAAPGVSKARLLVMTIYDDDNDL